MSINPIQIEKHLASALISILAARMSPCTKEGIQELAHLLAVQCGYEGILDTIIREVMIACDTRMGAGVSIVDMAVEHDEEWVNKRDNINWRYSEAYGRFLVRNSWHPITVESLDYVCKKIIGHLQDPSNEGSWDRRGLVIGHVQSGKTANYIGVIAKAADTGYKFIIVIAGIHNILRKQTQERIDEGFIGRSSDPENRVVIGVGLEDDHYPFPATLTNINDDFNKATANQSGWRLNDFSKPIIIVIKKNVRTLDALYEWLKEMNAQGNGKISDVPMLMIDDEADNASINTNKPELDPTKINTAIRKTLGLFTKSCYVGYTATPFANIFINPEAYDTEAYAELFPRDFIYCLDAPSSYFGPEQVFLDNRTSSRILNLIDDCESFLPFSHKKDDEVFELPTSLYTAIDQFIVARTIRNLRGHYRKHCSMMINISRFVTVQKAVRNYISMYTGRLRVAVKANYAMPEAISNQNVFMQSLKRVFIDEYSDCGFEWPIIKRELYRAVDSLHLSVINSKSDEVLDYKKYEKEGSGLTIIAIGGLCLSRGLTLEGLCISYMYRNTRMYDTLMQMGRWFGFRPDYEDLCRVFLPQDSIDWYSHISYASEELRQQIFKMRRDGLSPKNFGLYVRAHPDQLIITAANKMRSGERVIIKQNFSGRIIESYIMPMDEKTNIYNETLITEYWKSGFGVGLVKPTGKGWTVQDVPVEVLEEFLIRLQTHSSFSDRKTAAINYLQRISDRFPKGDVLLISITKNDENANLFRLGVQTRDASPDNKVKTWRTIKNRVASRGDEKLGLTDAQLMEAEATAASEGPSKKPSDFHYRSARMKPLLMLHIIAPGKNDDMTIRVPAFGISFPPGLYSEEIEVVMNVVGRSKEGFIQDRPEEEDDYDD